MRRTRTGDVVGYLLAAAILIGGGAIFTRKILTFNRGPAVAVAAIMLTGWAVDRLLAARRGDAAEDPDDLESPAGPEGTHPDPEDETADLEGRQADLEGQGGRDA